MIRLILFLAALSAWSQIPLDSGGGAANAVTGASNLTTAGAIPYVSAPGTLNQDATALFWDAANDRLGVGTNAPATRLHVSGDITQSGSSRIINNAQDGYFDTSGSSYGISIRVNSSNSTGIRLAPTTGNLLIGTTTDSNFKLDVATSGSAGTARFYGGAGVSDSTKVVVQAGGGQTGSLIEIQTSGGVIVGTMSTAGISMPSVASDGNLVGVTHQVTNNGRIEFSNGSFYSQSIRRRSDDIIAFDNNTAIGTTPGNARDVMLRGVYAAETTSDPSAADLSIAGSNAQDTFRLYMKNDKLVVAYNRSGTVNYLTIPLDGATTTWTQSTTAP